MKPIIVIPTFVNDADSPKQHCVATSYTRAVLAGGGLPLLLPIAESMEDSEIHTCLDRADGLLLPGGGDIAPLLLGEDPIRALGACSLYRDAFEITCVQYAHEIGMPILGICRGHQVLNFALGGTLWQDIYTSPGTNLSHQQSSARQELHHQLLIQPDSMLADILGTEKMHTNSFHHQAIRDPAPGLRVSARTSDGIVEAVEGVSADNFVLGVQFHPECLFEQHPRFLRIFSRFIQAAAQNSSAGGPQTEREFLL